MNWPKNTPTEKYSKEAKLVSYSASLKDRMGRFVIYAIVILLALICLLPLWNIVAISFSSSEAVSANAVGLLPVKFTTAAYSKIIDDAQFWRSFGISVLRVALSLVLNMILIVLMAYPLSKSKREFKGRNIYMNIMIFAMLFSGGMIPSYLLIKNLDMLNTIWALVLPGAVPIFSVILVMNFFAAVPKALEEAAFIDGANALQVLFKVYVPVSIPALATVSLFSIVGTWNDFFSGLIYMTKVSNYPLMTYIQSLNVNIAELLQSGTNSAQLSNLTEISNKNLNAAKIVVAVIPLLLIYPLLQKYFVTGIVVGSVKE
jgi:putative aldouronate transport system permease protein